LNISQESTGHLTAELKLQVLPEDYSPKVKEGLKKYAKEAKLPGFRPGKVPLGMVRKMVGVNLVIDTLNEIVNTEIGAYLEKEELNILGDPLPTMRLEESDFDINCEKEMLFQFEVGLAPEVNLAFDFSPKPTIYAVEIDDAYLDKEIEYLQDRMAEVSTPDEVKEGDIVYGRIAEVDEAGEEVEGGFNTMIPLNPERVKKPELFASFVGKKLEEKFPFDLASVADTDDKISELTFIELQDVAEAKEKSFMMEVKRINRVEKAELNAEFFEKVAGQQGWALEEGEESWTEESFRKKLGEDLITELAKTVDQRFKKELQEAILDAHPLDMPAEFLKKWMLETGGEEMTAEKVEGEYPNFVRYLGWSLMIEKLQKEIPSLKVESEDIMVSIRETLKASLAYRGESLSAEQEMEYLSHALKNKEVVDQHYNRLVSAKVFPYLKEQVEPAETPISATDFIAQLEAEKKAQEEEEAAEIAAQTAQAMEQIESSEA
jgi:trigger factor